MKFGRLCDVLAVSLLCLGLVYAAVAVVEIATNGY